jgi:hypothetical protein
VIGNFKAYLLFEHDFAHAVDDVDRNANLTVQVCLEFI